jgi:hypothetical protein
VLSENFDLAFGPMWNVTFKHPTRMTFFQNNGKVAGEDLSWFWRSWFVNNWRLDQGINTIKYVKMTLSKESLSL